MTRAMVLPAAGLNVSRFLHAQSGKYPQILREIRAGRKRTHWMWFVFPQLRALGKSETARYYGIADKAEAVTYLEDPTLRLRLFECTQGVLSHPRLMLSHPDNHKLRACMTLFSQVVADPTTPNAVLDKFYGGKPDQVTLDVLAGKVPTPEPKAYGPRLRDIRPLDYGREVERFEEERGTWPQAQVYAFVRGFGLSPAETHRLVRAWMADRDRSYDAGWNDYGDALNR